MTVCAVGTLLLAWGGAATAFPGARPAQEERPEPGEQPAFRMPTDAERKAATEAIEAQLKAFRDDDYETAEKYQSAGLRENFRSLDEFRQMMREQYPQFARYRSVRFGEARCDPTGDRMQLQAVITGQDGVTVRAIYTVVREDGEYRVAGVIGGARGRRPAPRRDVA